MEVIHPFKEELVLSNYAHFFKNEIIQNWKKNTQSNAYVFINDKIPKGDFL